MNELSLYLLSYLILTLLGFFILRVLVPRDYLRYGILSPLVAFLQGLLFFIYGGFPYIYLDNTWPDVKVSIVFHVVGVSLVFIGLGVLVYEMIQLGLMRSLGRGESWLLKSGLYKVTRNPQGIACGIFVIGFSILWPSLYAAGWVLLYFFLIHMMVLSEEQHLSRVYDQEYKLYCQSVPRYFGKPVKDKSDFT